jgi:hypothetical protein
VFLSLYVSSRERLRQRQEALRMKKSGTSSGNVTGSSTPVNLTFDDGVKSFNTNDDSDM